MISHMMAEIVIRLFPQYYANSLERHDQSDHLAMRVNVCEWSTVWLGYFRHTIELICTYDRCTFYCHREFNAVMISTKCYVDVYKLCQNTSKHLCEPKRTACSPAISPREASTLQKCVWKNTLASNSCYYIWNQ